MCKWIICYSINWKKAYNLFNLSNFLKFVELMFPLDLRLQFTINQTYLSKREMHLNLQIDLTPKYVRHCLLLAVNHGCWGETERDVGRVIFLIFL